MSSKSFEKWQLTKCWLLTSFFKGISYLHISSAYLQRGWKGQPDGGFEGLATSPWSNIFGDFILGFGIGIADNSASV